MEDSPIRCWKQVIQNCGDIYVMELCMQKKKKRNSLPMEIPIFHGKYPSKMVDFHGLFAVYRSVATSKALQSCEPVDVAVIASSDNDIKSKKFQMVRIGRVKSLLWALIFLMPKNPNAQCMGYLPLRLPPKLPKSGWWFQPI